MSRKIVEIASFPARIFTTEITINSTNKEIGSKRSSLLGWSDWGTIADNDPKLAYKLLDKPLSRNVAVDDRTAVILNKLDGEQELLYPGTYWLFEDEIKDTAYSIPFTDGAKEGNIISDLIEDGNQSCILNYWEIPDEYIDGNSIISPTNYNPEDNDITGIIETIYNTLKVGSIVYTPYSGEAQSVINNKTRYSQSVTVKIYNPSSGSSLTKNIYDALPDTAQPSQANYILNYRVVADIRPEGCPIFSFQYNDGGTDQLSHATEFIKGATWRKSTLTGTGVNGSYFDKLALNNARDELNTRTALSLVGSVASIGLGVAGMGGIGALIGSMQMAGTSGGISVLQAAAGGGFAGLAGTVGSYILTDQKLKNQEAILNAKSVIAAPSIQVGNADFMRDTGMNKFYYVFTSYNSEDMKNYDTFLTRYGYNVGKMVIRNRHFYSRKKFNYVKVNECHCISNGNYPYVVGKSILDKVEAQLKQGVRIWRKNPDAHDMLADGNNEINSIAYRS